MLTFENTKKKEAPKNPDGTPATVTPNFFEKNKKKLVVWTVVLIAVCIGGYIFYKKVLVKGTPGSTTSLDGAGDGGSGTGETVSLE